MKPQDRKNHASLFSVDILNNHRFLNNFFSLWFGIGDEEVLSVRT